MSEPRFNLIQVAAGETQANVDPARLQPSRVDLSAVRLQRQRHLLTQGIKRWTPILVCREGVICDGHHAVRAAWEMGHVVEVQVTALTSDSSGLLIDQLPVR